MPKQHSDWLIGVRGGKKNKLFGFITGIPVNLRIGEKKEVKMTEINFLCVHKKLRKFRLAPVLIKEITRRVNIKNMFQAVYTAGAKIPTPVSECRYHHRNLNTKKLIDIKFSFLPNGRSLSLQKKLLKLPSDYTIEGVRPMTSKDVKQVRILLTEYLRKMHLAFLYSNEEVKHFFLPRDNVIYTYVVEDPETKEITDMFSYYSLPSTILKNPDYETLHASFQYYNVAGKHDHKEIMRNALISAQLNGFDVYNCLDVMDNKTAIEDLHFGAGSGNLYYYLYNYSINDISQDKIGIVLV